MNRRVPEFICLGVQRGGTTWLDKNLRLHPEIFLAKKEIHFFTPLVGGYDFYRDHGYDWYYSYFNDLPKNSVPGEIAVTYLGSEVARQRITKDFPSMRFIVMLRNPAARFNSIYEMVAGRREFQGTLREFSEDQRGRNQLRVGLYYEHIQRWKEASPSSEICILFQDDIISDPSSVYRKVCDFIGVDKSFVPDGITDRVNEPHSSRSDMVRRLYYKTSMALASSRIGWVRQPLRAARLPALIKMLNKGEEYRVPLSADDREWLVEYYRHDIEALERYMDRDLSAWKR